MEFVVLGIKVIAVIAVLLYVHFHGFKMGRQAGIDEVKDAMVPAVKATVELAKQSIALDRQARAELAEARVMRLESAKLQRRVHRQRRVIRILTNKPKVDREAGSTIGATS